jgi:hypothetical protein
MRKAAREAAFDEERNDALRRSVGLVLPRQERRSSLAPLHSHVVGQASLGRLEALPVHELTLEQLEREERPERLRVAGAAGERLLDQLPHGRLAKLAAGESTRLEEDAE